jgi:hypothetical protein
LTARGLSGGAALPSPVTCQRSDGIGPHGTIDGAESDEAEDFADDFDQDAGDDKASRSSRAP